MRPFFLQLLQDLYNLCGLRQWENINLQDEKEAKMQINALLDALCLTADRFPEIPEEVKKRIIKEAVISDIEFNSLNARIVYKWLSLNRNKYFEESHHKESKQALINQQPIVVGEARDEWLNKWKQEIGAVTAKKVPALTADEIQEEGKEKPKQPTYRSHYTPEQLEIKERIRIARAQYYASRIQKTADDLQSFEYKGIEFLAVNEQDAKAIVELAETKD